MSAASSAGARQHELFERGLEHGDRRARTKIIEEYMPLAKSLARRYMRSSEPMDDLVQVASLALVKAVDRFDPARGCSFATYAVPTILGELRRYFRDSGWALHVPRAEKELAREVVAAEGTIAAETGRSPTVQALAEYMELDVERVLTGLAAGRAYTTQPFEAPEGSEDPAFASASALATPDPGYEQVERRAALAAALGLLEERELELLRMRFGEELSQAEISRRIGVSQMHVSRLLRRALQTMRGRIDDRLGGSG